MNAQAQYVGAIQKAHELQNQANGYAPKTKDMIEETAASLVPIMRANDNIINENMTTYVRNRRVAVPEDKSIEEIEAILAIPSKPDDVLSLPHGKGDIKGLLGQVWKFEERNTTYLNNYAQEKTKFSLKAQESIRAIEEETNHKVKVVIDKEMTQNFRSILGISYRGGAYLGQYIVVDDPKVLEDEEFLRHEAIHCMQQRDLGFGKAGRFGFLRWMAISYTSLGLKILKVPGLDEAMDYGTDNQITDFETYLNQFTKGYLKTRQPNAWKKYRNADFRKQEMNRFKQEEITLLKDKIGALTQQLAVEQIKQEETTLLKNKIGALKQKLSPEQQLALEQHELRKNELSLKISQLQHDVEQYKNVYENLKDMNEVLVVMIKPDVLQSKKEDTREQIYFESERNREIRLPIERFIQKHGKTENAYKEGVAMLLKINEYIDYTNLLENYPRQVILDLQKSVMKFVDKKGIERLPDYDVRKFLEKYEIQSIKNNR